MNVETEFTCCEVDQVAITRATGGVDRIGVRCSECGLWDEIEVDTTDYN